MVAPQQIPTTADRIRQVVVSVTVALAIVGAFLGSGAFGGTPVNEAADGALSSGATVLGPSGAAFSIWSVIYAGLIGYTIWQALPAQAGRQLHRAIGYGVAASAVLNAAWIGAIQLGQVFLSLVIIVVLLVGLLATFAALVRTREREGRGAFSEIVFADGMIGLYLGWVSIATGANLAALLAQQGFDSWTTAPGTPGMVAIFCVAGLSIAVAARGGRLAPAVATAWGLSWIAVERWTATPVAPLVAVTATVVAAMLVVAALMGLARRLRRERVATLAR